MSVEVVRARCAGVDVHKHTVVVHIITPETRETRTFGTMTDELCELRRHRTQRVIGQSADRTKRVICRHPLLGRQVAQHMLRLLVGSAHVEAPFLTAWSHRSTPGSLCRSLARTFSATCWSVVRHQIAGTRRLHARSGRRSRAGAPLSRGPSRPSGPRVAGVVAPLIRMSPDDAAAGR